MIYPGSIDKAYCKYETATFSQPTLTANGTMGGTSFACSVSNATTNNDANYRDAYGVFDGNNNTYWRCSTNTGWLLFYNPTPIKVSSLVFGYFYSYVTGGNVQGSNDNSSWTTLTTFTNSTAADFTITVNSPNYYKYYKINITGTNTDVIHCTKINITAIYETGNIILGTESDYDFIKQLGIERVYYNGEISKMYKGSTLIYNKK